MSANGTAKELLCKLQHHVVELLKRMAVLTSGNRIKQTNIYTGERRFVQQFAGMLMSVKPFLYPDEKRAVSVEYENRRNDGLPKLRTVNP